MKIAFVLPGRDGGGVRSIVRIADGLIARGHDVVVLYGAPRRTARDFLRGAYLNIRYGHRQDWLASFAGQARPYETITPQVVGHNDLVVGVGVDCVLAIAELSDECGVKVHNSHGMEPWIPTRMSQAWQLPMPRIVSASYLVQKMRSRGSEDLIFVVGNGVDRAEYYPSLPESLRRGVGTVYHGGKDPATVLSTLCIIHGHCPDMPIYMFGTCPRPANTPTKVQYMRLPTLDRARDLYSRSLVWFCGSRHEGFGLPLLEAMACGCVVVSTDCGGPADFIEHGVNGFLVSVGEADALSEHVLRVTCNADLRKSLVTAASVTARRLTWTAAVDAYESALKSVLA